MVTACCAQVVRRYHRQDETFLLMALEINNPAAEVHTPILLLGLLESSRKSVSEGA